MQEVLFNNGEMTAKAMGLVIDDGNRTAYYASFAAPGTGASSVWASLVSSTRSRRVTARGWYSPQFSMAPPSKRIAAALPGTNEQHYLVRSMSPSFVLIDDPAAATLDYYDRQRRLQKEHTELLHRLITDAINAVSRIPWAPEWTPKVLENPPYNAWTTLRCWGDALVAYLINPSFEWVSFTQERLRNGYYYIPPQPLVERANAMVQAAAPAV